MVPRGARLGRPVQEDGTRGRWQAVGASEAARSGTGETAGVGPFLVTGGAGGIGGACVAGLRASGRAVVAADLPGREADVELDVTDPGAVEAVVQEIVAEHGGLGGVVAAAGVGVGGPVETLELDDWHRVIDVNLWGSVHLVRSAYPHLVAAGAGHVVLVASLSGLVPTPLLVPYAASKWAVVGLARSLAPEAREHGVGVTAVCPGPVDTEMLDAGGAYADQTGGFDARRYLTDAAGPALPPAAVADAVVRCLGTRKVVVAPGRARVLGRLGAIAPATTARVIAGSMRRELRRLDRR